MLELSHVQSVDTFFRARASAPTTFSTAKNLLRIGRACGEERAVTAEVLFHPGLHRQSGYMERTGGWAGWAAKGEQSGREN